MIVNNLISKVKSFLYSPASNFYQNNGIQKALKSVLGNIIEMNRLFLYNYHTRNFTATISVILAAEMYLDLLNTNFIDNRIYPLFDTNYTLILTGFEEVNNLSVYSYMNYVVIQDYINNRSDGFLLAITDFTVYTLPMVILLFIAGYLIFKITFNYKISVIFRAYSFMGYIFCMIF